MSLSLQFLGGVGTVTGSKFLLESSGKKVLIDCGLFQGLKALRLQNRDKFPIDPSTIDAVLITHAHLDHTGYLPLLVKNGFKGKIYCTFPTRDLAKLILLDSAKIQEEDAARANREGFSSHAPALPLYEIEDSKNAISRFERIEPLIWTELWEDFKFQFIPNGHILGSAAIAVETAGKRIVFSGDLGRADPLVLHPPLPVEQADYVVIESTYGDRLHPPLSPLRELARIVNETHERKGHLIIPSFAVGRAQDILFLLSQLRKQSQIPNIPVFLDSPMAISATDIFVEHAAWHRLNETEIKDLCESVTVIKSAQQSEELLHRKDPSIVIAGSGMASGGRVLEHLSKRLTNDRNTVLLVGYQAAGTRGRLIADGAAEVKMRGHYVTVRAHIERIDNLSAHADQKELLAWLGNIKTAPRKTFIVHGEPQASDAFRVKLKDTLGWQSVIPKPLERFEL